MYSTGSPTKRNLATTRFDTINGIRRIPLLCPTTRHLRSAIVKSISCCALVDNFNIMTDVPPSLPYVSCTFASYFPHRRFLLRRGYQMARHRLVRSVLRHLGVLDHGRGEGSDVHSLFPSSWVRHCVVLFIFPAITACVPSIMSTQGKLRRDAYPQTRSCVRQGETLVRSP